MLLIKTLAFANENANRQKNRIINFYEYEILYYTLFKVNFLSNFYKNKLNEIFNLDTVDVCVCWGGCSRF